MNGMYMLRKSEEVKTKALFFNRLEKEKPSDQRAFILVITEGVMHCLSLTS